MKDQRPGTGKIVPLETMRGVAAFMVFLFHFVLGFVPQRHGEDVGAAIPGGTLIETPFFFIINGHAAVTFFFVLSGFVLSYGYFVKGDNDGLIGSVIKRWPRLFPLALISTLLSWLMIQHGLYTYTETSTITESNWMARFANSTGDFLDLTLGEAFMQGFFLTFFRGDQNLNTSLWTMYYEFIGSLLVFGLIPILNGAKASSALILFVTLILAAFYTNVYMCAFILGCFLSFYRCQIRGERAILPVNRIALLTGLLFVVLAFGYVDPGKGFYSFMRTQNPTEMLKTRVIIHAVAAVILIEIILSYESVYKYFDGRIGRLLGRCSFALYVIHVPLMFSFSTYVFLAAHESLGYWWAVSITFVCSVPMLFLISWLMTVVDESWHRNINRIINRTT